MQCLIWGWGEDTLAVLYRVLKFYFISAYLQYAVYVHPREEVHVHTTSWFLFNPLPCPPAFLFHPLSLFSLSLLLSSLGHVYDICLYSLWVFGARTQHVLNPCTFPCPLHFLPNFDFSPRLKGGAGLLQNSLGDRTGLPAPVNTQIRSFQEAEE